MFAPKILLFAAAAWLLVVCIRRRKPGFSVLTMLGVGTIVAGLAVFGMRSSRHDINDVVVLPPRIHHDSFENGDFVKVESPRPEVRFHRGFPFGSEADFDIDFDGPPKWMIISMGTLLVIAGSLLAGRERTRPAAMKAFTLLGVGAIVYSVVSFFGTPPRIGPAHDRVVRVSQVSERDRPAPRTEHKAKRPSRAKRPTSRPQRPDREQPLAEALPPRAGEIPVSAELTTTEANSNPKADSAALPVAAAAPVQPAPPAAEAPPSAPQASPAPPAAEVPAATTPADAPITAAEIPVVAPETVVVATVSPVAPAPVAPDKPAEISKPAEIEKPAAIDTSAEASDQPAPKPSAGRPEWVDAPARLSNSVYTISISSGLFVSVPECQREINAHMKQAVDHYIDEYRGDQASKLVSLPLAYLNEHVKKAEYSEVVHSDSVGPMHQIHALLEIDDRARADIDRLWHNAVVTDRLWYTGSGAALVLALLGTFYGYLRLDLRTGGAQKGRLQLAATLVALIVAAGALMARWAVPF